MNKELLDTLDAIGKVIVILGVPIAIFQYIRTTQKERRDREYGTYNSLDEKYLEWEKICLSYSYLDIFDVSDNKTSVLDEKQKKEELILFTILFSIFERAYLLYSDESSKLKKNQWSGWNTFIIGYSQRDNFKQAWKTSGTTFDTRFQNYMEENIKN
jgi:hypothetical protein